jgi:aldose 1-epimerase
MFELKDIVWIETPNQRLGLLPAQGGAVAAWNWRHQDEEVPLWCCGGSPSLGALPTFPMLPWVNRISGGGFEHGGQYWPVPLNRSGEPWPIHGDGWLQAWTLEQPQPGVVLMRLQSDHHAGNPYVYDATQRFELTSDGLRQQITITHRGEQPLPYGVGLHPWLPRTPRTCLTAAVGGLWLSGDNPMPIAHTTDLPPGHDLNIGVPMCGELIDNTYTGWQGVASVDWPELGLTLSLKMLPLQTPQGPVAPAYLHIYRPPQGEAFCVEPASQPVDAFNVSGRPGLVELQPGETLTMELHWSVSTVSP